MNHEKSRNHIKHDIKSKKQSTSHQVMKQLTNQNKIAQIKQDRTMRPIGSLLLMAHPQDMPQLVHHAADLSRSLANPTVEMSEKFERV